MEAMRVKKNDFIQIYIDQYANCKTIYDFQLLCICLMSALSHMHGYMEGVALAKQMMDGDRG